MLAKVITYCVSKIRIMQCETKKQSKNELLGEKKSVRKKIKIVEP